MDRTDDSMDQTVDKVDQTVDNVDQTVDKVDQTVDNVDQTVDQPKTYISVTGYEVKIEPGEVVMKYDRVAIEKLFTDPITQEWYKDPVIMNEHLYDRSSLQKWLRKSSKDPLKGVNLSELGGKQNLISCNIVKFLLFCLEMPNDSDETINFHSPPNDIMYAQKIGKMLPIQQDDGSEVQSLSVIDYIKGNRKYWLPKGVVLKDCDLRLIDLEIYTKIENSKIYNCINLPADTTNCEIFSNINNYSIQDYIFTDFINGKKLVIENSFISKNGFVVSEKEVGLEFNSITSGTKEAVLDSLGLEKCMTFKFVLQQFQNILNYDDFVPKYNPLFKCSYYLYNLKPLKSIVERTIEVRSRGERVWQRLAEMRNFLKDDDSLLISKRKISSMISKLSVKKNYATGKSELMDFRKSQGYPFLVSQDENMYGMDLSMLDLSGKRFNGLEFKDYLFSGSNLTDAVFENCSFMECCFVGADLSGSKFINCKFNYIRPFFKTKVNSLTSLNISSRDSNAKKIFNDLYEDNELGRPF